MPGILLTSQGSAEFRNNVCRGGNHLCVATLWNNRKWIFDIHQQYSVALVCISKNSSKSGLELAGPYSSKKEFNEFCSGCKHKVTTFTFEQIRSFNETLSLPVMPNAKTNEVLLQLCKHPRLVDENGSWRAIPYNELHATGDKAHMNQCKEWPEGFWPVYKGESFNIWQPDTGIYYAFADPDLVTNILFDKRLASYRMKRPGPFDSFGEDYINNKDTLAANKARIAFRDITNSVDSRTVFSALIPPGVFLVHTAGYIVLAGGDELDEAYLLGLLNSMPLDWFARRFVKTHLSMYIVNSFPVPRPARDNPLWKRVVEIAGRLACVDDRFKPWAKKVGVRCGKVEDAIKHDMIHELDAVVALLYGLSRKQLSFVFDTFHAKTDYGSRKKDTLGHYGNWQEKLKNDKRKK